MKITELETDRLLLRQWKHSDYSVFFEMNTDPAVMEYFPSTLSKEESNAMAEKCASLIAERGWGFWAAELKKTEEFIGFVGLHCPKPTLPFSPCVEIGWRLSKKHWGNGYATEAASASLQFAFTIANIKEIVSFTTVTNLRSQAVMVRLGMVNTQENFNHPDIDIGHTLSEHVLYKITKVQV